MRKFVPAALIAGIAVFAATDAFAGQITAASGPIKVNGKTATLPVTLAKGDKVETGANTATFKSDAGDLISIEKNTTAKSDGVEGGVEYFFVEVGVATGTLSEKTTLGVSVSWATAPKGGKTQVRVEAPADRPGVRGLFRTLAGGTWLRNDTFSTWLPELSSVTLWRDRTKMGSLCFSTSQQNPGMVDIVKRVAGGDIRVSVPRATSGCVEDLAENKTKISNDLNSNKQEKVHVETEFGAMSKADIGPSTYAIIDNQTGGIETFDEGLTETIGEEIPSYDSISDASDVSVSRKKKR